MVQPTPWQVSRTRQPQARSPGATERKAPRRRVEAAKVIASLQPHLASLRPLMPYLRGQWGYVIAAIGSLITFNLLFKPWLTTRGLDGSVTSNAFGQTRISTTLVGLWAQSPPAHANLSGKWAVLASAAITVTVAAAVLNIRARNEVLARLTAGSAVAVAFFVVFTMVYLNGKGVQLRNMVGTGRPIDPGTQLGYIIRWASGNGDYPLPGFRQVSYTTATLTSSAMWAGAMSVMSAVAATTQWMRGRTGAPIRLPWRIAFTTTSPPPSDSDSTDSAQGSSDPERTDPPRAATDSDRTDRPKDASDPDRAD